MNAVIFSIIHFLINLKPRNMRKEALMQDTLFI